MEIRSGDDVVVIKNILVGDVWVCSGQSNMQFPMSNAKYLYTDEIANSENPSIRHFLVPERYDYRMPQQDLESGKWVQANPETVLDFSAVGYFFAAELWEKYHIPVGLINTSVGGAPAEAFLSRETLKTFPDYLATAKKLSDLSQLQHVIKEIQKENDRWYNNVQDKDKGLLHNEKPWFDPEYDASRWPVMLLPAFWDDKGLNDLHGVVWFRKDIIIPASMTSQRAKLFLGRIVDSDTVYINGTIAGTTAFQHPPRIYDIPATLLKPGKNTIVIRVINTSGRGGFIKDKPYFLESGGQTIDLKGEWQYSVGAAVKELPGSIMINCQPMGLYNGMIAPLIYYTIKGVLWYQGESNTQKAREYQELFPALIAEFRKKWGQGDFPFLYVQLANFMEATDGPCESEWAELRDAQLKTLAVPNTGMAVTIDIGEWNDLHPLDKKDVGHRLFLAARKVAYGEDNIIYSGPIYESMKTKDHKIVISFSNTGTGLISKGGGKLKCFAIADVNKRFVPAMAKIEDNHVVVWSKQITDPVVVRYAWANNPEGANLYNKEGLPASPFTTG